MATQVDINLKERYVRRVDTSTGSVSYSDLSGKEISAPASTINTTTSTSSSRNYTPAYYTPAPQEQPTTSTISDAYKSAEGTYTPASPEAIREATTFRGSSRARETTDPINPNFNLITPGGVVPAEVTYDYEKKYTPASPEALRAIDIRAGYGISGGTGQISAQERFAGRTPISQALGSFAFQLGVKEEQITRSGASRSFSDTMQLIGLGVTKRAVQVEKARRDYLNIIPTPGQMSGVQYFVQTKAPVAQQLSYSVKTAYQTGGIGAVTYKGLETGATMSVAPLYSAYNRPGEFLFDTSVIVAGSIGAGALYRSVRGTPSGKPMGEVVVSTKQAPQTRTGYAGDYTQTIPKFKEPTIRLSYKESRGPFYDPAKTTIDLYPSGTIKKVRQTGKTAEVTIQQPNAKTATQYVYEGSTRNSLLSQKKTGELIRFTDDLKVYQDAVTMQRPRSSEIITDGGGIQQAQATTMTFLKGTGTKGTIRTFSTLTEQTTLGPIRITEARTTFMQSPRGRTASQVETLGTSVKPQRVQYVDYLTQPRAPRLKTKTSPADVYLNPTPEGNLRITQQTSTITQTPPPLQKTTAKVQVLGTIERIGLFEQLKGIFPRRGARVRTEPQFKAVEIGTKPTQAKPGQKILAETIETYFKNKKIRTSYDKFLKEKQAVASEKQLTTGLLKDSNLVYVRNFENMFAKPPENYIIPQETKGGVLTDLRTFKGPGLQQATRQAGARGSRVASQQQVTQQKSVQVQRLKVEQLPKTQLKIPDPYTLQTAQATTLRLGFAPRVQQTTQQLGTQLNIQRPQVAQVNTQASLLSVKVAQQQTPIQKQNIMPIQKTQLLTSVAPIAPLAPRATFRPPVVTPNIPIIIIPPLPRLGGGAEFGGADRKRGRTKGEQTKTVLQQFLTTVKVKKGKEVTGLFLRG